MSSLRNFSPKQNIETHLLLLASSFLDPLLAAFRPRLVDTEQASLSSTLDELVRLDDELIGEDPARKLVVRGNRVGFRVPSDLSNLCVREDETRGRLNVAGHRRGSWEPVADDSFAVVFKDRCRGHGLFVVIRCVRAGC